MLLCGGGDVPPDSALDFLSHAPSFVKSYWISRLEHAGLYNSDYEVIPVDCNLPWARDWFKHQITIVYRRALGRPMPYFEDFHFGWVPMHP
jgi:hypothetical protein